LYIQVVEKWLGKEACSSQEFDGIDLTNRLGSDKVLFKVTWDSQRQKETCCKVTAHKTELFTLIRGSHGIPLDDLKFRLARRLYTKEFTFA
jgi:hypothetical protein